MSYITRCRYRLLRDGMRGRRRENCGITSSQPLGSAMTLLASLERLPPFPPRKPFGVNGASAMSTVKKVHATENEIAETPPMQY